MIGVIALFVVANIGGGLLVAGGLSRDEAALFVVLAFGLGLFVSRGGSR